MGNPETSPNSPGLVDREPEAAKSDTALIEALKYLDTLRELDFINTERTLQKPLTRLFEYAQERMRLGGRDRELPKKIKEFFQDQPNAPQWVTDTDMKHTVASFAYLAEITRKEFFNPQEQKIVLSAMVVHDCAYPQTEDFAVFTGSDARLSHMRNAETEFRNFAQMINREFHSFYSDEEIDIICSIVRQHDNPSIKKDNKPLLFTYSPPPAKILWAHREADRLWMLDRGGFALDLARRILESNPSYDPEGYLKHVISSHLKEGKSYEDNAICFLYQGEKSLYRTSTGFEIFGRLARGRAEEYHIVKT